MRSRYSCLLLVMLVGTAGAEQPAWLVEARAREGKLVAPVEVSSADNAIRFKAPLPLQGKLTDGGKSWSASFELGPKAVASCEILKQETDAAAALRQMALISFTDIIEPQQGRLEVRGIERIDAGIVGATPYLQVSWIYRVNDGKVQKLGALQQIAANHGNHGIYCALNDLGYKETFGTLVRTLIDTLRATDDTAPPHFREVSLVSIRDMRVGYSYLDLSHDKDGNTLIDERSVLLVPETTESLRAQDTLQQQVLRPDGSLLSEVHVASSNGEIDSSLALKAVDGGAWSVEGRHQGKDIQATIPKGTPGSWLSQTALRRSLLAAPKPLGTQARHTQWVSTTPAAFTEATMKVIGASDANTFTIRETSAGVNLDYVVDRATGQATSASMKAGPLEFHIQRVYVQGKP